jgi:hypothetical protein
MKIRNSAAGQNPGAVLLGKGPEHEKIRGVLFGRFYDSAVGLF